MLKPDPQTTPRDMSDDDLIQHLLEIALMLTAGECPDSGAQVREAAYRLGGPDVKN